MTNMQSHRRFRLVLKSMTLDDLERPLCAPFHNTCVFGAYYENLNKDRPELLAAKMWRSDCSFWQYKVHEYIR